MDLKITELNQLVVLESINIASVQMHIRMIKLLCIIPFLSKNFEN
jgi:hypothetical protein